MHINIYNIHIYIVIYILCIIYRAYMQLCNHRIPHQTSTPKECSPHRFALVLRFAWKALPSISCVDCLCFTRAFLILSTHTKKCHCFRTKRRKTANGIQMLFWKSRIKWKYMAKSSLRQSTKENGSWMNKSFFYIYFYNINLSQNPGIPNSSKSFLESDGKKRGQFGNLPHRSAQQATNLGLVLSCSQSRRMRLRSGPRRHVYPQ